MNTTPPRNWNERADKIAAVLDVLRYILSPPSPLTYDIEGKRCVNNDNYARLLFEEVGKVQVPDIARVVFLATSQYGLKERGSLVLEMPPASLHLTASPADLQNYALCGHEPSSSSAAKRDWYDVDDKADAITDVLRHISNQPPEIRERCLNENEYSSMLFREPRIGNINVPPDVKTIFVPSGEREREIRGSLVIVLPPESAAHATDQELLLYVVCCYRLW
jgi:hypothetical protein